MLREIHGNAQAVEFVLPGEIEGRSFAIITKELEERGIVIPKEQEPVTKRVIHTSADFGYADTLTFSENAVEIAKTPDPHRSGHRDRHKYGALRCQQKSA